MNTEMKIYDKSGNALKNSDLVLLEVFEPKLKHTGPTLMLGRVNIDYFAWRHDTYIRIDMGEGLSARHRYGINVELANDFEEEFKEQVKSYEPFLMLYMLEN